MIKAGQSPESATSRKVIVAFYANPAYGSDWRVGRDYINFAESHGFDTAIIAELDKNAAESELVSPGSAMRVIRVPWFSDKSSFLYRFTDFLPQIVWHLRVMNTIRARFGRVGCIWVSTSSAQPWFPLAGYLPLAEQVVWGPVGGGGHPPPSVLERLGARTRVREGFRNAVERLMFRLKVRLIRKHPESKVVVLARTREVQLRLANELCRTDVPLFPEFLHLVRGRDLVFDRSLVPRFIWAGQDIPRKDLELGLTIFRKLRERHFPSVELDVFGCKRQGSEPGVHYHGWVQSIDWSSYSGSGVLILSSFREGLSAVLVEAISHGLACIATPVGAIPSFRLPNVILLTDNDHMHLSDAAIDRIADQIREHLAGEKVMFEDISFDESLAAFLASKGVIGNKVSFSQSVNQSVH